ncbi:MAG: hypothetical protein ACK4ZM_00330 [bacterium]
MDAKSFDNLNSTKKIDFSNNFDLSTVHFSNFSNFNLNNYRFNIDINTVYKLKKNVYIDFNTSFGLKETILGNSFKGASNGLQLEVNPKLKVYVKF